MIWFGCRGVKVKNMALFLATYVNKLDRKGRLSIPAPFRTALTSDQFTGVVLTPSHQYPCLEGFSYETMEELSTRLDHYDLFSSDQDDLATALFGQATPCNIDDTGRIVLPESLMTHANLTDKAAFVGLGRKFQIWHPDSLAQRQTQARDTVKSQKLTLPALGTTSRQSSSEGA